MNGIAANSFYKLGVCSDLNEKIAATVSAGEGYAASLLLNKSFDGAKDKFDIKISLDPSQAPVAATAKFRGQNALFATRKSYTVNIEGGDQRFFTDGAGSDEFYLIAMAQDPSLFYGCLGYTIYSEHDIFPLHFCNVGVYKGDPMSRTSESFL